MHKFKLKYVLILLMIILPGVFYFAWLAPKYTVPILMYHNIGYEEGSFSVSPENFARQMEYLGKNGYKVISLDELVRDIRDKIPPKQKRVVITFDDGYLDNFQDAYPVLKRYGFEATIFIITDFIGKVSTGKEKKFLNWEQVKLMSQDKITFGSHTKGHFNFSGQMDEKVAQEEIVGSKKIIEGKIGLPVGYLCYPSGVFNDRAKELVAQAGYLGACVTNRGFVKFNRDVYELKRIKVTNSDTVKPFSFWAKLSGFYNVFKKDKNPY